MNPDLAKIIASKRRMREAIAARPIDDKLRLLDAMRECDAAILSRRRIADTHRVGAMKNCPSTDD